MNQIDKKLFKSISDLIEEARSFAAKQVNTVLVFTYYKIGKRIVEHEQGGEETAVYAQETLKSLSRQLTKEYGKGYSVDNLEKFRKFFIIYRTKISESVIRKYYKQSFASFQKQFKLSWTHYSNQ